MPSKKAPPRSGQLNVRTDKAFEADLALIQNETRIADRTNTIHYLVRREATRIRRRRSTT